MPSLEIGGIQRIFLTRLDTLSHVLDVGAAQLPDLVHALRERLASDMHPLGTQVAFACNQPLGFAQWCAGEAIHSLPKEVDSLATARDCIARTKARVAAIAVDDAKLDDTKRIELGHGMHCELPGRQYVADFLMPNFYFHITMAYAILRRLGVPLGKADYMRFLAPYVQRPPQAGA